MAKLLSPLIDVVFKILFTRNLDLLKAFTAAQLDLPKDEMTDLTLINTEIPGESPSSKFNRLDLNVKLKNKLINIEIQRQDEMDFRDRAMYYWARLFSSGIKSGDKYSKLTPTISLNILDFNIFSNQDDYHTEIVTSIKGTTNIFSDKFSLHFIELKKFKKWLTMNAEQKFDQKVMWTEFINARTDADFEHLRLYNDPDMNKAIQALTDISDDPEIQAIVQMREDALHEEASALATAEARGEKRGEKRATKRASVIFTNNLKNLGFSDEMIEIALHGIADHE